MKTDCPNPECQKDKNLDPKFRSIVRNGSFRRSSDSRRVQRFFCRNCLIHFSAATDSPCFNQKKRRINHLLWQLTCSGISQRRAAKILCVNPKTVVRRFRFFASQAKLKHQKWLREQPKHELREIQFDDLETSEHTKCKPLSVALAVDPKSRKILSFQVSQMPAKGHLARIAFYKYGYRQDERSVGWDALMKDLVPLVHPKAKFTSDQNPHYPKFLLKHHPHASHVAVKGGRGCIAGQGELKKLKHDPLFYLNHTCAMMRANLNRLFRKTWCNTKNRQGLSDHLAIYVHYHNTVLVKSAG